MEPQLELKKEEELKRMGSSDLPDESADLNTIIWGRPLSKEERDEFKRIKFQASKSEAKMELEIKMAKTLKAFDGEAMANWNYEVALQPLMVKTTIGGESGVISLDESPANWKDLDIKARFAEVVFLQCGWVSIALTPRFWPWYDFKELVERTRKLL